MVFDTQVQRDMQIEFDSRKLADTGIVEVAIEPCFLNCARYIHKHARLETSPYVPAAEGSQPHPSWRQIDVVQDALSDADRSKTQALGKPITMDGYVDRLMTGRS